MSQNKWRINIKLNKKCSKVLLNNWAVFFFLALNLKKMNIIIKLLLVEIKMSNDSEWCVEIKFIEQIKQILFSLLKPTKKIYTINEIINARLATLKCILTLCKGEEIWTYANEICLNVNRKMAKKQMSVAEKTLST